MEAHNAWINQGFNDGVFLLVASLQPNAGGVILAHSTSPTEIEASLGWIWRFSAPVFVGDTITAGIAVTDRRTARNPARAILCLSFVVRNQLGRVVQEGDNQLMVYRRDKA